MAAGVVHHFKMIQVKKTQSMMPMLGFSAVPGLLSARLKFAPVNQIGQHIMASLVGKLRSHALQGFFFLLSLDFHRNAINKYFKQSLQVFRWLHRLDVEHRYQAHHFTGGGD